MHKALIHHLYLAQPPMSTTEHRMCTWVHLQLKPLIVKEDIVILEIFVSNFSGCKFWC